MYRKWTFKYSFAAVISAIAIIAVALLATPGIQIPTAAAATFTVMMTDPPTVPDGTTVLNLTYTDIALHVTYPNQTTQWLSVGASGTVNLFSLINVTQTIATTTIPLGSTVDKLQFVIQDVTATVNGIDYNVTALTDTLIIKVASGDVNQTLSGVLFDFNPTLVQIQATDENGLNVEYYVLVPSATAVVLRDLNQDQARVGTIVTIGENHRHRISEAEEQFSNNVTITSASISVNGNQTTLSVTLKNDGNSSFRVFGLTLKGEFNSTKTFQRERGNNGNGVNEQDNDQTGNQNGNGNHNNNSHNNNLPQQRHQQINSRTLPFKVNGTSLVPLFGTDNDQNKENGDAQLAAFTLEPEQTLTLTFSGVISLHQYGAEHANMETTIIPMVGSSFTLRLMGEGFQTFTFTAI